MPKPRPSSYYPEHLGADCINCPLRCKGKLPVPPTLPAKPKAIVIGESPDNSSKFAGKAFLGKASQELLTTTESAGLPIAETAIVYRIACEVPRAKRIDSLIRKAAKACAPRVHAELAKMPADLPRLYLGKWAPMGVMGARQYNEKNEIKLSKDVVRLGTMAVAHPSVPFAAKPALRKYYKESLGRFAKYATGDLKWPTWEGHRLTLGATQETLDALVRMGPVISVDIESLGTDPLADPMTCIGISDGTLTVTVPWHTYDNRHGHHVGIEHSPDPLHVEIRAAIKRTLESRKVVGQNLSYDLLGLGAIGITITDVEDTMDASKILDPEIPAGLGELAARHLILPSRWKDEFGIIWKGKDSDQGAQFTESPQSALLEYNAKDALTTILIWEILERELTEED